MHLCRRPGHCGLHGFQRRGRHVALHLAALVADDLVEDRRPGHLVRHLVAIVDQCLEGAQGGAAVDATGGDGDALWQAKYCPLFN